MLKLNMNRIRCTDNSSVTAQVLAKRRAPQTDEQAAAAAIRVQSEYLERLRKSEETIMRFYTVRASHRAEIDFELLMRRLGVRASSGLVAK